MSPRASKTAKVDGSIKVDGPAKGRGPAPAAGPTVVVSIDGGHCHLYGICEAEAPAVFRLVGGRLHYRAKPGPEQLEAVRSAARLCPMQAIHLRTRT